MIDVKEILSDAEERMEMAAMFLDEALAKVRAGRANIAIVSGVRVESYGMMVPLRWQVLQRQMLVLSPSSHSIRSRYAR